MYRHKKGNIFFVNVYQKLFVNCFANFEILSLTSPKKGRFRSANIKASLKCNGNTCVQHNKHEEAPQQNTTHYMIVYSQQTGFTCTHCHSAAEVGKQL